MVMAVGESREFKCHSRHPLSYAGLIVSLLFALSGVNTLRESPSAHFTYSLQFVASVVWIIGFLWLREPSYIRINNESIIIRFPGRELETTFQRDEIKYLQVLSNKKFEIFSQHWSLKISLRHMNEKEREELIHLLQPFIKNGNKQEAGDVT